MIFTDTRRVVRSWPSNNTAGGGYVEDDKGRVWRVLEPGESPNSLSNTTGVEVRTLTPDGTLR